MNFRVSKTELLIALYLIPFFTYAVGFKWPLLGVLVYMGRYLVIALMIIKFVLQRNYIFLLREKTFVVTVLFFVTIYLSTIISGENIFNAIQLSMYGLMPFLIFWNYRAVGEKILGGIEIAFSILIILNGIIMLVYPQGIYQTFSSNTETYYYLFGAKNQMVAPVLVGMCFIIENSYQKNKRLTLSAVIKSGICIGEILVGGSGTGLATIIFIVIILAYQNVKKRNINSTLSLCVVPFIFFIVVILRMQNLFSFFIEGILNKSLDLSNRTYIWDAALASFIQNPLIGTGVSESMAGSVDLRLEYTERITFAHNAFLDILLIGGVVAMLFFILIILFTLRNYKKTEMAKTKSIIWGGLVTYLIASVFDIYTGNYCMFLITAYITIKQRANVNRVLVERGVTYATH